jgi:hypothetical protein
MERPDAGAPEGPEMKRSNHPPRPASIAATRPADASGPWLLVLVAAVLLAFSTLAANALR